MGGDRLLGARCLAVLCGSAVVLVACQPIDRVAAPTKMQGGSAATAPLGAPEQPFPQTIGALLDHAGRAARQWQDGAVLAEVAIGLEEGRWRSAEATYVAPDSDRFLRFTVSSKGSSKGIDQSRPTLATLSLKPIDRAGVARIPPLSERALDPAALRSAAGHALAECGIDPLFGQILYATGAPFAWDGSRWTQELAWTATISDGTHLLVVDPASGKPVRADACRPLPAGKANGPR